MRSWLIAGQVLMMAGVLLISVNADTQGRAATGGGDVRAAIEAGNKKFIEGAAKGDAAMIATAYTTDAEAIADRGKYCVVWKRVGGQWLLHRDIWSTSMPEVKK